MLNAQNSAKVQKAMQDMRMTAYNGQKCAKIVNDLAATFGPAEDGVCIDVLTTLKSTLEQKLKVSGGVIPAALQQAFLDAQAQRTFAAPAPQNPFANPQPPHYTAMAGPAFPPAAPIQQLTQQVDLLSFQGAPAVHTQAAAPGIVRHATGFAPSARAEQLYKVYEENKESFADAADRDAQFLVQEFKPGTKEHNEVIDMVYVLGRIALDQRRSATIKYFSQKPNDAFKITRLADLERAVDKQGTRFPKEPPMSSNLDTALWSFVRVVKDAQKKNADYDHLSLYLICDGTDNDDPESILEGAVTELKDLSIPKKALGIQAVRVGDNAEGEETLDTMDDSTACPRDHMDHIKASKVEDLGTLLKAMFGGSNAKMDKKKV